MIWNPIEVFLAGIRGIWISVDSWIILTHIFFFSHSEIADDQEIVRAVFLGAKNYAWVRGGQYITDSRETFRNEYSLCQKFMIVLPWSVKNSILVPALAWVDVMIIPLIMMFVVLAMMWEISILEWSRPLSKVHLI